MRKYFNFGSIETFMASQLLDKVETNGLMKYKELLYVISVVLLFLFLVKVYLAPGFKPGHSFEVILYWLYSAFFLLVPPISIILFIRKNRGNRSGQFVEWWNDKIIYKSKGVEDKTIIAADTIKEIKISLDQIEIQSQDQQIYLINIEGYSDNDMRLRIKSNFEKYRKGIND
jgi:hypothetical protein